MCKYCSKLNGEDYWGEDIIDIPLDFGIAGDYLNLSLCINVDDGEFDFSILDLASSTKTDIFVTKKINYCPFCGRKLSEEVEE